MLLTSYTLNAACSSVFLKDLQQEDLIDPSSQDLLYQGDAEKWLKFAYALKARYTMHLLQRSTNKDADMEKVLEYVSKSLLVDL